MSQLNLLLLGCGLLVALSWLLPQRWQRWSIAVGTALFLAIFAPISLLILALSTITSFGVFRWGLSPGRATLFIIAQSLGYFVLFKAGLAQGFYSPLDRLIPLGLSYYAFRQIHYAIERYKGKLPPHSFWDYAAYLFFLPTMLIGPIHRFGPFLRHSFRRRWDQQLFSEGLQRILYGYAKIAIVGNFLLSDLMTDFIDDLPEGAIWMRTYLTTIKFFLNTFFQFAGFSDIAIGLALLMGFRVMENFRDPFFAPNVNEFWNRWHISLTSWCRDYVYTPVASITRRAIPGILLTMLTIGLWHELSLRYLVWAMFHGVGIAIWHIYKDSAYAQWASSAIPGGKWVSILLTFHFVALSFILIRVEGWGKIGETFAVLFFIG